MFRKVQFGFKVWLALAIALAIILPVSSNFPKTASWKLYYGLITVSIVMIERVVSLLSPGSLSHPAVHLSGSTARDLVSILKCVILLKFL